jgi:hypothetical protein
MCASWKSIIERRATLSMRLCVCVRAHVCVRTVTNPTDTLVPATQDLGKGREHGMGRHTFDRSIARVRPREHGCWQEHPPSMSKVAMPAAATALRYALWLGRERVESEACMTINALENLPFSHSTLVAAIGHIPNPHVLISS